MKRVLKTAVFTLCLAFFTQAATVPVQNMTPLSLAAEYMHTLNGHEALWDADSSALAAHFFRLHYAPANWLRFSGGFGGSHPYAEPSIKGARTDLAVTAGLGLYLPRAFDFLSLTAGYDGYYLKTSERAQTSRRAVIPLLWDDDGVAAGFDTISFVNYEKRGYTSAALHVPYAAAIFHMGRYADLQIGGLYQYFDLIKKTRTSTTREMREDGFADEVIESLDVIPNIIQEQVRVFATLTLHERESGAYLSGGFSYALTNQALEGKSHLNDFSFWAQIGLVMTEKRTTPRRGGRYRGSYADLIMRQEYMAAELNRDFLRDKQRRAEYLKKCKNHRHDDQGNCIVNAEGEYLPLRQGQDATEKDGDIIILNFGE
jgi:hypothetical protein